MPNFSKQVFLQIVIIIISLGLSVEALAEEIEMVNRPVNTSGLTGLLVTTSPYTAVSGTVEVAASILSENSVKPDFTITEYPLSVTVGLPHNSELALRASYFELKEGPTATATADRKAGDFQLSYKWNFLPPIEASPRPAVALIIGGMVPLGNNPDPKISTVVHWGALVGLSAGSEIEFGDHILGIYADAQLRGQDLSDKSLKDIWEVLNMGLLFPISKYRNLQIFVEYTIVHGREKIPLEGGDYSAAMYGLRLLNERFNVTIGTQFLHKKTEGYDDSDRLVGMMSVKF